MSALSILFWLSFALIVYTYVLFPLIVAVRGRLFKRPYTVAPIRPSVSLVMAMHNEEQDLPARLENLQQLDYPRDRFEVVIASDGSTDRTNQILKANAGNGYRMLLLPRMGKAQALNAAVAEASGEILVFSDANSLYAPDAIQRLVEPFADSGVGGVAGNQVYRDSRKANLSQSGEKSYWNFDRRLKIYESQAGNVISATGAIYAIRHNLFQPVVEGVTDDFYTSTAVIEQGQRLVFEPLAISYEPPADSAEREFRRKVRIVTRGLRSVIARRGLLNPLRYGFYSLQLFSHKILRRLVVVPLLLVFITSLFLAASSPLYALAAAAQIAFYSTAAVGYVVRGAYGAKLERRLGSKSTAYRLFKLASLPFFFSLVNAAALLGLINILRGSQIARWEPQRAAAANTGVSSPHSTIIPATGVDDVELHAHMSEKQRNP